MCAAAQMRLALFDELSVVAERADVAGEGGGVGIARVNAVADFLSQGTNAAILDAGLSKGAEAETAVHQGEGDTIGRSELAGVTVAWALLGGQWLPQPMHGAFANLTDDLGDALGRDTALVQAPCTVDVGLDHGAAGIGLEGHIAGTPDDGKAVDQGIPVALARVGKAVEEPVHPLKHRAGTDKAGARQ